MTVEALFSKEEINNRIETYDARFINQFVGDAVFVLTGYKWVYMRTNKQLTAVAEFLCLANKNEENGYTPGFSYVIMFSYSKDEAKQIKQREFASVFKRLNAADEFLLSPEYLYDDTKVPALAKDCVGYVEHKSIQEIGNFLVIISNHVEKPADGDKKATSFNNQVYRTFYNTATKKSWTIYDDKWKDALDQAGYTNIFEGVGSFFKDANIPEISDDTPIG